MFEKIKTFFTESIEEVRYKVTWSTYSELQSSTVLVLVASTIFALAIGLVDYVFQNGMNWFYSSF